MDIGHGGIFGGPCRGRTYGPLIKSCDDTLPPETQDDLSEGKIVVLEDI